MGTAAPLKDCLYYQRQPESIMDPFTVNKQIEEIGYFVITDLSEEELSELLAMMAEQDTEQ
jgi:hypothetical protein